jgi:GYF domain 2
MHNTHAAQMWHLARGKQPRVIISDHELRLLAQQGRLHAEDLLWRRGFDGWRIAFSIPGLLTPPPLPESSLVSDQADKEILDADVGPAAKLGSRLHQIGTAIGARVGTNATRWLKRLLSLAQNWLKRTRLHLRVYGRKTSGLARRTETRIETVLGRVEHPRVLACLLAIAIAVGALDIAMQSSFAVSAPALPKYQGRPPPREELSTLKFGLPALSDDARSHTLIECAFVNFQPTAPVVWGPPPERVQSQLDESASQEVAKLDAVPLPTRKPLNAIARASERIQIKPKRLSQERTRAQAQPKPLAFGTIGFNYSDPGL